MSLSSVITREAIALYQRTSEYVSSGALNADMERVQYLKARGAFTTLAHPEAGTHNYQTLPFRLSVTPGSQHTASPVLGAHTQMVLSDILKVSADELDELNRDGVTSNVPDAYPPVSPLSEVSFTSPDEPVPAAGAMVDVQLASVCAKRAPA